MSENVVLAYIIIFTYLINILFIPLFDIIYYMLYPEQIYMRESLDIESYIFAWIISPLSFILMLSIISFHILVKILTFIFKPLQEIVNVVLKKLEK